jgi:hypothetical protein
MDNIGIFVSNEQIGSLTSVSFEIPNPNEYEYYLRRGNRVWLRNQYAKILIEANDLPTRFKGIKYGEKLIVKHD